MSELTDLFEALLGHHGVDRYPTPQLGLIKIQEELGEVSRAFLRGDDAGVAKELGDVVLAVQGMARHYGIDVMAEVRTNVALAVGRRVDPSPFASTS